VALTGLAQPGDREKCAAAGMDDYLTKPLQFSQLEAMLQRWLKKDLDQSR
jgi:CheY-like chemotaxis protein